MTKEALKQAHLPIVVRSFITRRTPKILQYLYVTDLKFKELPYPEPVVPLFIMLLSNRRDHYAVHITMQPVAASEAIKVYSSVFKSVPIKSTKKEMVQQLFGFPAAW